MNDVNSENRTYKYYHVASMIFISLLIISNTVSVKVFSVLEFNFPAGIICFPLAYIINDVLTEVYGFKMARSTIWWSFTMLVFMSTIFYITAEIEPASFWKYQSEFEVIFKQVPRIFLASLMAYLVGSLANAYALSKLKKQTKGKYMGFRLIASTGVGELLDSFIFNYIAFYGLFQHKELIYIVLASFSFKTIYEIIILPVTFVVVRRLKKIEGLELIESD